MVTTREPITFDCDGTKVFGIIHWPAGTRAQQPAIAIFHGLLGSKDQPHRIFVTLAERLAQAGFVALRIDFPCRGDSEGETIDMTVEGDMTAARMALDVLTEQPDVDVARLGLVGMSWGGAIAASLAGRDQRVSALALWSSAPDDLDWKPQFEIVEGREVQEMWGNLVGRQFYDQLHSICPIRDITTARGPVLLAYGTDDEVVPQHVVDRAVDVLRAAGINHEVVTIKDADHAFMRYAHKRELIERTVDWFGRVFGEGREKSR